MKDASSTTRRTGLGAPSTAAQSRHLKKWALAKNIRSWIRYTTTPGVMPESGWSVTST
jgi:hypothetical protein